MKHIKLTRQEREIEKLRELQRIVEKQRDEIIRAWQAHFWR